MIECRIKINNFNYKVRVVAPDNRNLLMEDGRYHFGVTEYREKEIYIANNLPAETFQNTLIHELTHAIIDAYGLLQIKWDDEVVADFVATYMFNMSEILDEVTKQLIEGERRKVNEKFCKMVKRTRGKN